MENEPPVQYSRLDSSVKFVQNTDGTSTASQKQEQQQRKFPSRHSLMLAAKILIPVCLIIVGPALTFSILHHREKSSSPGHHARFSSLPDVANLTLVSTSTSSFTVTWERPEGHFDFYSIHVAADNGNSSSPYDMDNVGSCASDGFIHPDQTNVTCRHFAVCTNLNFTLRTGSNKPTKETSTGVTLHDIFIIGPEPYPPKAIIMTAVSPSLSRLQWNPPQTVAGTLGQYTVKVCDTFTSCYKEESLSGCTESQTSETWLEFDSNSDTAYCVLVTASSICGAQVLTSRPAAEHVRTPLFELPDVANLSLVVAGEDFFTVAWVRPDVPFDYYVIKVEQQSPNGSEIAKVLRAGSCSSGNIIHPNQTQVTCSHVESCTKWTFTLRTYRSGPPVLTSMGAILSHIVILNQESDPPNGVNMATLSPSITRLYWGLHEKASANTISYAVNICDTFTTCDAEQDLSACSEHETSEKWLDFSSTADTFYCVQISATPRCWTDVRKRRPAVGVYKAPHYEPPPAANLGLEAVTPGSFVVNWEQPEGYFDYYSLETILEKNGSVGAEQYMVGSCATGTLLPVNQTRATCDELEACTKVSFTLRTVVKGPPESSSKGVTINGISIPGKVPEPPTHVTAARIGASAVELKWEAPVASVNDSGALYSIEACETCVGGGRDLCCWTENTTDTSLSFNSTADNTIWVKVTSGRQCGEDVAWSKPAKKDFAFAPLDVTALRLTFVSNDSFTATWERPRDHFDYYLVQALSRSKGIQGTTDIPLGSCANGTIIHPEQSQVTCGPFEARANMSLTVRTHRNGPPQRTSNGVTLEDICIPGAAGPPDVVNLQLATKGSGSFTVTWVRPVGCFSSYLVDFIDNNDISSNPAQHTFGTCSNTAIDRDRTSINCSHVAECSDITVRVRTRHIGPPERTSAGVTTRYLGYPQTAVADFTIQAHFKYNIPRADITITLGSKAASCLRKSCSGDVKCSNVAAVNYYCSSQINGVILVHVYGLSSGIYHTCYVKLVNSKTAHSTTKKVYFYGG